MFPIRSIDALKRVGQEIERWDPAKKEQFFALFGPSAHEDWYVREIGGHAYVICVSEGENLDQGLEKMAQATDEFTVWFRQQVLDLTATDLGATPHDPRCELVYSWGS
jgi:hypothetical protein